MPGSLLQIHQCFLLLALLVDSESQKGECKILKFQQLMVLHVQYSETSGIASIFKFSLRLLHCGLD